MRLLTIFCISALMRDICALIITQITNNKTSIAPPIDNSDFLTTGLMS